MRDSTDGYVASLRATACVLAAEGSKEEGGYLVWVVRIQLLRIDWVNGFAGAVNIPLFGIRCRWSNSRRRRPADWGFDRAPPFKEEEIEVSYCMKKSPPSFAESRLEDASGCSGSMR